MNHRSPKKNSNKVRLLMLFASLLISIIILALASSQILKGGSYCPAAVATPVTLTPKNQRIVEIRVDGTTVIDNQPFFPFGFYHVSWKSTAQERRSALRDIAAAGFNTIHASATNLDDYGEFLDEAERLGVYVLTEQNSIGLLNLINAFKQKLAVLGWSMADDVDNGKWSVDNLLKSYQQAKTADPNHITYVSGYSKKIKQFANFSDVIARQSYPIKWRKLEELPATYSDILDARAAAAQFNRSTYANLQTYNWQSHPSNKYDGAQAPTFQEVRNMTYQALLAGTKGILYYTYHDSSWHLPDHPDLWEGVKSLVPEIKAINSFVLNGDFQKIKTGENNILAGIWQLKKEALAVVINTSFDRDSDVTIELPRNILQANPMFPDYTGSMSFTSGKLSGLIKPVEVQVYRLKG